MDSKPTALRKLIAGISIAQKAILRPSIVLRTLNV